MEIAPVHSVNMAAVAALALNCPDALIVIRAAKTCLTEQPLIVAI
jgi:hypothetical protein